VHVIEKTAGLDGRIDAFTLKATQERADEWHLMRRLAAGNRNAAPCRVKKRPVDQDTIA
jgi:hypothetical protein